MSAGAIACRYRLQREAFDLDASFEFAARGVTALYGPSGSGKTTLLRCIAGLEPDAHGELAFDGQQWDGDDDRLAPHRRACGIVFQDARLFSHLSVRANLDYGAKRRNRTMAPNERQKIIDLLGLDAMLARMPRSLSGGEQRRVAIGRALFSGPSLLLLDEPLGGLDARRRDEILPYLDRLHATLPVPTLLVSHRQDEVERLSDRLVVLDTGKVIEQGSLGDVLARADIAGLLAGSVIDATVVRYDPADRLSELEFDGGRLFCAGNAAPPGSAVRCLVRARDVSVCPDRPGVSSILNVLGATVERIVRGEVDVRIFMQCGNARLLSQVTHRSARELNLKPGQQVFAQVKSVAVRAPGAALPPGATEEIACEQ